MSFILKQMTTIALSALFGIVLIATAGLLGALWVSLPQQQGKIHLPILSAPVTVTFDTHAIPTIAAENRLDAYRALGYLHASNRLFQMDLNRRKMTGTLAEIFAHPALRLDIHQRTLGFSRVARKVVDRLPPEQKAGCSAYAAGVNAYLIQQRILPPEFLALGYRPAPWQCADTILIILSMFQLLDDIGNQERMLTVMAHALPKALVEFLTPDEDPRDTLLMGQDCGHRPVRPVPVQEIAAILAEQFPLSDLIDARSPAASNQWAVNTTKGALLANDMHLPLGVPNLWYLARLRYSGINVDGVTLPGAPGVIAGSNGHIGWGFTNAMADVRDLVILETNRGHPDRYRSPGGWEPFLVFHETVAVKGETAKHLTLLSTRWGPVMERSLLGKPVALSWTALDPANIDLRLLDMDRTGSVAKALTLFNQAGLPVQNVMAVDTDGHIGWTLSGRLPRRQGFDGTTSLSWASGSIGWNGYLMGHEMPRIIDPPKGFLVTANQRTLGCDQAIRVGHNYAPSWRAHLIHQQLDKHPGIDPSAHFNLQLDTAAPFYRFYRDLALQILQKENTEIATTLRSTLKSWDGHAERNSTGLPLLDRFHERLEKAILNALLAPCQRVDPDFRYQWLKKEVPLRQLLRLKHPDTLPDRRFDSWQEFLHHHLIQAAAELKRTFDKPIEKLTWGEVNRATIRHPLSPALPLISRWLDMPRDPLSGCATCIRVALPQYGASMRLIVRPGKTGQGILHMPTGQIGHFLSSHYADLQTYWVEGIPLPLSAVAVTHRLRLLPSP